jgi:hypothetical protein
MTCPNDCSGHGTCETMSELAGDASLAVGGKAYNTYGLWDWDKVRGCKCDAKYAGADCSERMCPRGDDALSKDVDVQQTTTTSLQVSEVQNATVQSVMAPINGGEITFTYTDLYNGVWTTRPVTLPLVKTFHNQNGQLRTTDYNWQPVVVFETTLGLKDAAENTIDTPVGGTTIVFVDETSADDHYAVTGNDAFNSGNGGSITNGGGGEATLATILTANSKIRLTCETDGTEELNAAIKCPTQTDGDNIFTVASTTDVANTFTITTSETITNTMSGAKPDAGTEEGRVKVQVLASVISMTTTMAEETAGSRYSYSMVVDMGGYYELNPWTATAAAYFRKGDQLMIGNHKGTEVCYAEVAEDSVPSAVTAGTASTHTVKLLADPLQPACGLGITTGASATRATIFSLMQKTLQLNPGTATTQLVDGSDQTGVAAGVADASNPGVVSISKAASGLQQLTLSQAAASKAVINQELVPGTWIRVYDEQNADGEYCDFEFSHATSTTVLNVLSSTASSTYKVADPNLGVAHPCTEAYGKSYAVGVFKRHAQVRENGQDANLATYTIALGVHFGTLTSGYKVSGLTTTSATLNSLAADTTTASNFAAADLTTIIPGVVFGLVAGTDHEISCVGQVTAVASGNTFTFGAAPAHYTDTRATGGLELTSCLASTTFTNNAFIASRMTVLTGNNFIRYAGADSNNFVQFEEISAGDYLTVSNAYTPTANTGQSSDSETFQVAWKDPAATAAASVFFTFGPRASSSTPNDAGWNPVLIPRQAVITTATTMQTGLTGTIFNSYYTRAEQTLPRSALVQVYYTSNCTWCLDAQSVGGRDTDENVEMVGQDATRALQELPNNVIPSVDVKMAANTLSLYAFNITFSDPANSGNQNEIAINSEGCVWDGCQPRYDGVRVQTAFKNHEATLTVSQLTTNAASTFENRMSFDTDTTRDETWEPLYNYPLDHVVPYGQAAALSATADYAFGRGRSAYGVQVLRKESNVYTARISNPQAITFTVQTGTVGLLALKSRGDRDHTFNDMVYFKSSTTEITRGTTESSECAGRGACDTETGLCECYEGYYGESCSKQTVML